MALLFVGIGLSLVAVVGLWWFAHHISGVAIRVFTAVSGLLLLLGMTMIGINVWALGATGSSQLARALVWGDSQYGDQARFPVRRMTAASDPIVFPHTDYSRVSTFRFGPNSQALYEVLESNDSTAFIVLEGDQLLYEGYFNGSSHEDVQTSFSVAKSFISTLIGIAIGEEKIGGLDDRLTDYVPELLDRDSRFGNITLHDLIVMASGLSFDYGASPWADPANTYHGTNLRSAAITKPRIVSAPGEVFHYNDWNVILLGIVLERVAGIPVSEYMETRLWQPMGAEADGSWSLDSEQHGLEKMFVGVNGRAIDFAKLGWLYVHDGRNGDSQVVPAEFVADATRLDDESDPASTYQYLWWIDESRSSYFANGDHGQFIYVDPSSDLVIVRHGRSPGEIDWVQLMGDLADWLSS